MTLTARSFDARANGTDQGQTWYLLRQAEGARAPTRGRCPCAQLRLREAGFLKKSLGTNGRKSANVAATGVLAVFDTAIEAAEALLAAHPVPPSLTDAEIRRMAAAAGGT